jgi:hypothetical protein
MSIPLSLHGHLVKGIRRSRSANNPPSHTGTCYSRSVTRYARTYVPEPAGAMLAGGSGTLVIFFAMRRERFMAALVSFTTL